MIAGATRSGHYPPGTLLWGRTPYAQALERQQQLVEARLAGHTGDVLVLTEHEPVFTLGARLGAAQHLLWGPEDCAARGIAVVATHRGGDITYHGPGQIVGYPIVDLRPRGKDLHAYLRDLEEVLRCALGRLGLVTARREGKTGLWVGTRKIAALGVAVRQWVAWHGFAVNVQGDLSPFSGIVPCGIAAAEGSVTSLEQELGTPCDLEAVRRVIAVEFWRHFADTPPHGDEKT